jgi:NAD(P)-dependent dehydrogenase (short-subunit alcohol dehydrogenase family)
MNVWLITGASRGFGREIARQALDRGDAVVATARQPDRAAEALPACDGRLLPVAQAAASSAPSRKPARKKSRPCSAPMCSGCSP